MSSWPHWTFEGLRRRSGDGHGTFLGQPIVEYLGERGNPKLRGCVACFRLGDGRVVAEKSETNYTSSYLKRQIKHAAGVSATATWRPEMSTHFTLDMVTMRIRPDVLCKTGKNDIDIVFFVLTQIGMGFWMHSADIVKYPITHFGREAQYVLPVRDMTVEVPSWGDRLKSLLSGA